MMSTELSGIPFLGFGSMVYGLAVFTWLRLSQCLTCDVGSLNSGVLRTLIVNPESIRRQLFRGFQTSEVLWYSVQYVGSYSCGRSL